MIQKQNTLSYSRLVSRTKYYQNKALELEKRLIFTEENLEALKKEQANGKRLQQQLESQRNELQEQLEEMRKKWEEACKKINILDQELEKERHERAILEKELESSEARKKGTEDHEKYQKRITEFERLLAEIQKELNEKEQKLQVYRERVKQLEKRSRTVTASRTTLGQGAKSFPENSRVIAFFDYSLIFKDKQTCLIRGHLHIENCGERTYTNPFVCFRFYPLDAARLKGKIVNLQAADEWAQENGTKWVFVDDEWGQKARERGEIWVRPYREGQFLPGDVLTLADFQIPLEKRHDDKIVIEGFVYFQGQDEKLKVRNQILLTF